jgi:hypothetical protein
MNCYGRRGVEAVKNGNIACFGTVGGAIKPFVKFLRFMVGNKTQWFECLLDKMNC